MGTFTNTFTRVQQGPRRNLNDIVNLVSSFDVPSISGVIGWNDTNSGTAQYDVYKSTNGGADVFLTTTALGATSYADADCNQNATVVYKVKARKGAFLGLFVSATSLLTPLCLKTNQSVLTPVVINQINIAASKTVTVNWGDGTSQVLSGSNLNVTKNYAVTGQYNFWFSGDTDSITIFSHNTQSKTTGVVTNWVLPALLTSFYIHITGVTGVVTNWVLPASLTAFYISSTSLTGVVTNWVLPASLVTFYINSTGVTGVVTNWVLPASLVTFYINSTSLTGVVTNWVLPASLVTFYIYSTGLTGVVTNWVFPALLAYFNINSTGVTGVVTNWVFPASLAYFNISSTGITGSLPNITAHATNGIAYNTNSASIIDSNVTVFRKAMTIFDISNQNGVFPTANINKLLKALADWYQVNAPTANCTINMSGVNMGIPTGGSSNADLIRLVGYYTSVSKSCTVLVRTS